MITKGVLGKLSSPLVPLQRGNGLLFNKKSFSKRKERNNKQLIPTQKEIIVTQREFLRKSYPLPLVPLQRGMVCCSIRNRSPRGKREIISSLSRHKRR